MMIYVADTHALLWFLSNDPKLGKNAKEVFEKTEKNHAVIIIPSIVLAECVHILEKHKKREKFKNILEKIKTASNYETVPLDINVIERIYNIKTLNELHDRILVATTQLLGCKLITKDENITESKEIDCVW